MPMFLLLQEQNATVTLCHSKTENIGQILKECDIVVAAVGMPQYVQGDWLKEGWTVIDVGIHYIEDKTRKSGKRLVGDVDYKSARKVAKYITPVPGGVGPMTIAMLMKNTVKSWLDSLNVKLD
jgi:methylenetetrahydrofolate dehydrogenase (NADP+)/methenyltetrahydrofolate cyclohydrolase/formyltetrahydrofolate synthetase